MFNVEVDNRVDITNGLKDKFFELLNDEDWIHNPKLDKNLKFKSKEGGSIKAWTMKGDNPTSVCMKWEHWYPETEPEDLWEYISNLEKRVNWDDRWIDGRIVEER